MEDTEMVSEDELPPEAKEQLDTEAVSDEELPESTVKCSEDLLDTEAVSEDEFPVESDRKKKKKVVKAGTIFQYKLLIINLKKGIMFNVCLPLYSFYQYFSETEAVSEDELPFSNNTNNNKHHENQGGEDTQKTESLKRKIIEGEYDPSSPTSENSQDEIPAAKKVALDSKNLTPKSSVSMNCKFEFYLVIS